jgi:hypothetical protein
MGFRAGDANLYRFVGNDPANATDPSGQIAEPVSQAAQPRANALNSTGIIVARLIRSSIEPYYSSGNVPFHGGYSWPLRPCR